jgi:HEAT repeat protein
VTHPVLARLRSPDPGERVEACRAAVSDASAVLLLDALAEALGDPVKAVSRAASEALAEVARSRAGVEPVVRAALRSEEPRRRCWAAFTHARLVPPGPLLLPPLVEALDAADGDVRWTAARLLVEAGRLTGEVLPLLLGLARGAESPVVRRMAAHCLRQLAPDDPAAARALLAGTRDPDVRARRACFAALAALIDPPDETFGRLAEAVDGEADAACRRIATVALGALGGAQPGRVPAAARAALARARAEAGDPDLRRGAERALARLAPGLEEERVQGEPAGPDQGEHAADRG